MIRTITAAEVVPGQRIRWTEEGTTHELTVDRVRHEGFSQPSTQFRNDAGGYEYADPDTLVTVLAEPSVIQFEPRWFGACAVGTGYRAVRASGNRERPWTVHVFSTDELVTVTWRWLCERGPVTVLPEIAW